MNWRSTFLDNLGFKVAAFVVVAMLWISVTADERQAQPVRTVVSVDVSDTTWVLVEYDREVNTTFTGRNRELLGLLMEEPVVGIEVDSVTGERMRVPLPVDRVEYDRDLGVVPSFIVPPAIDLRFERRVSARVPVTSAVEPVAAPGYVVTERITVEPGSVTVRGPATWIEDVSRLRTRAVRLEDLSNTVIRDVPLDLPEDVPGASADPSTVLVTVGVDSLIQRDLRVPVRLTGPGADAGTVEPESVSVSLRGAAGAVERWIEDVPAIEVELSAPPAARSAVRLGAGDRSESKVGVVFDPAAVTIGPRP